MNSKAVHKVIGVYLLLGIFLLPFFAKSIHIFNSQCCHEQHTCSDHASQKSHHDCNTCPVCQFTLSTFVESTLFQLPVHSICFYKTESVDLSKTDYTLTFSTHFRRGPPKA